MLLDTSGLLCLHHRHETHHHDAYHLFRTSARRILHNYVIAEFVALARARRLPRVPSLRFAAELLDNPGVELRWVDEALHRAALRFVLARPDKGYSLCDAVSFLVMRQYGVSQALTTDQHFEQEGFVRMLKA